jgi:glutamate-1-semialdehyde 2,1-aminomutase
VIRRETRPSTARGTGRRSEAFSERAHHVIPGGAHTFSRGDDQFPVEAPRGFTHGKGARVWDIEGDEYVDWGMGINNVLVGHAEDAIDDAAVAALRQGQGFSRPSELEVATAEDLVALFPGMEMAKFGKNGSDANTAAVRLARAITGRSVVGYDAAAPFLAIHDWFIGKTAMGAGIPEEIRRLTVPFQYNDVASVERMFAEHGHTLAAVVLETCRDVRPVPGFLETLRRLCDAHGTLLVFDEIVTGFRYALHGAYTMFGVTPDLVSVGKGIANGYALSAILGTRDYMERGGIRHGGERVFFLSTTNGPEQSALAAARATIALYRREDVIGHLARVGRQVIDGVAAAAARHGLDGRVSAASDFGARPFLAFRGPDGAPSMEFRTLFIQEMVRRSVFMPWVCPSFRHGAVEVERTLEAIDASCAVYARALDAGSVEKYLVGPAAKPVFRKFN